MTNSYTSPEIKSSSCITEHITATIDYNVTNYLQIMYMGVGEFVSSPVFRVGDYDWDIKFYPAGQTTNCAGNTSCFLRYLNQADVCAEFTTMRMMVMKDQEKVASFGVAVHTFAPGKDVWGFQKFVERSKLESMSRLGDGCFTIRCVLTVRKESRASLELPGHLERMLRDGTGVDVTFSVGGREYRAHRALLAARSPVFRQLLFGPAMEKSTPRVEVVDVDPFIFEIMLHYIYTDSLPPSEDDGGGFGAAVMRRLLAAAGNYGLDRLKLTCEEELCKKVDPKNVTALLALAYQHDCTRLKETCMSLLHCQKRWTPS